jgi:hypothetical protein
MTMDHVLTGLMRQQSAEHFDQQHAIRQLCIISSALDEARDYFADRADVTGDAGDIPNAEMSLQIEIEQAQEALARLRKHVISRPILAVDNDASDQPVTMGR